MNKLVLTAVATTVLFAGPNCLDAAVEARVGPLLPVQDNLRSNNRHRPMVFRKHTSAPIYKMSRDLMATYQNINDRYYLRKNRPHLKDKRHARIERKRLTVSIPGEESTGYDFRARLGKGSTGKVWLAKDRSGQKLAVKAVKRRMAKHLKIEAENLKLWGGKRHIVGQVGFFFTEMACLRLAKERYIYALLIMPFTGEQLYTYLQARREARKPLAAEEITDIVAQVADGLSYLHGECQLVHTDIKPENITVEIINAAELAAGIDKLPRFRITIIDLTSASSLDECHPNTLVASRYYRPLEVLLRMPWGPPCDVYALGCIVFELFIGIPPVCAKSEAYQISKVASVTGLPKTRMYAWHGPSSDQESWHIKLHDRDSDEFFAIFMKDYDDAQPFDKIAERLMEPFRRYKVANAEGLQDITYLIAQMIHAQPESRPSAAEVLHRVKRIQSRMPKRCSATPEGESQVERKEGIRKRTRHGHS